MVFYKRNIDVVGTKLAAAIGGCDDEGFRCGPSDSYIVECKFGGLGRTRSWIALAVSNAFKDSLDLIDTHIMTRSHRYVE